MATLNMYQSGNLEFTVNEAKVSSSAEDLLKVEKLLENYDSEFATQYDRIVNARGFDRLPSASTFKTELAKYKSLGSAAIKSAKMKSGQLTETIAKLQQFDSEQVKTSWLANVFMFIENFREGFWSEIESIVFDSWFNVGATVLSWLPDDWTWAQNLSQTLKNIADYEIVGEVYDLLFEYIWPYTTIEKYAAWSHDSAQADVYKSWGGATAAVVYTTTALALAPITPITPGTFVRGAQIVDDFIDGIKGPTEPPTEVQEICDGCHMPKSGCICPLEKATETPTDAPTEAPTETKPSGTEPKPSGTEAPSGTEPKENPTEQPTEQPTEKPTEQPTEKPTEQPTERPTEPPKTEPNTGGPSGTEPNTGGPGKTEPPRAEDIVDELTKEDGKDSGLIDAADQMPEIIDPSSGVNIPSSSNPIGSTVNAKDNNMIPLMAGLGAAAVAGLGTKVYLDHKENKDNEEELEAEEWDETEEDVAALENENYDLGMDESDYLTPNDEFAYQPDGVVAAVSTDDEEEGSYEAVNSSELSSMN